MNPFHSRFHLVPFLLLFLLGFKVRQVTNNDESESKSCNSMSSCGECISNSPNCAWCKEKNPNFDKFKRCDIVSKLKEKCPLKDIVHPIGEVDVPKDRNKDISPEGADIENVVQLSPQYVKVKLRKGQKQQIKLKFRQAEDYPVDLYYLMDVSATMKPHKDKLGNLGTKLAQEMNTITRDFRLGFGSFVDKEVMPFVSTVPEKLKNPCVNTKETCDAPHSFISHMNLSSDSKKFKQEVDNTNLSANLDSPEGGFDAIMQSMLCEREIGWRQISRRLLIFSTDSGFHYAGDGKLGGIVKPFDGRCHMYQNRYIKSKEMDYPSISHINQVAIEKRVHLIFAVTEPITPLYERLTKRIVGSATGKLDENSDNVVDLIKDEYKKIRDKITLRDDSGKSILVRYYSNCLHHTKELKETKECEELSVGDTVTFNVELELLNCPDSRTIKPIVISPIGVHESMTVEVELVCDCDCEHSSSREINSPTCSNGNGTYACGICKCNKNRYGQSCQCSSENAQKEDDEATCKKGNSTINCSNRGSCFCGLCLCNTEADPSKRIYGQFCECDNFSCERRGNLICSGESHGTCYCGECQCKPEWSGKACECRENNDTCMAPGSKEFCSGNGECKCGNCKCKETKEGRFSGQYCEDCPKCAGKCETYKPCVQCMAFGTGPLAKDKCANCTFTPIIQDTVKEENSDERPCIYTDEDDCKFTFVYGINQTNTNKHTPIVRVQRTKECPKAVPVVAIVGGVIGGIVLIGLLIIFIWKLVTSIHDKREYVRFEQERKNAQFDSAENPLYKKASRKYANPMYDTN